jgi:serine phosphatase RsbU (regulator of sigma subunit)
MGSEGLSPAAIADAVNRELCQNNDESMFVSLFLAFLDTRTGVVEYINAGHPMPHVVRASGVVEQVDGQPAVALAVRPGAVYRDRTVILQPGDAIFVCSDGVTEAMNVAEEFYGDDRLEAGLRAAFNAAPDDMVHAMKKQVDAFAGDAPKADDVTMLALRWEPTTR